MNEYRYATSVRELYNKGLLEKICDSEVFAQYARSMHYSINVWDRANYSVAIHNVELFEGKIRFGAQGCCVDEIEGDEDTPFVVTISKALTAREFASEDAN